MRDTEPVSLDALILHSAEPRAGKAGPTCSTRQLALDQQPPEVLEFILGHIRTGLTDRRSVAASLAPVGDGNVSATLNGLFGVSFVDSSRDLARRLFDVAADDGRIKDGTYAFARFVDVDEVPFVAILKFDPTVQFRSTETTVDGVTEVVFEPVADVLPSPKERLQKSAFLPRIRPGRDFDALVLDGAGDGVSQWLFRALGAEEAFDERRRTSTFYETVTRFAQEVGVRSPAQADALRGARDAVLHNVTLDVVDFADERANELDENDVDELRRRLVGALPDAQFDLDRDLAKRLRRRRKFRGDNKLYLAVEAGAFDTMVDVERIDGGDDTPPRYKVTIETTEWDEV